MKLLFDQNLSYRLAAALADLYPDSAHVRLLGMDQADDEIIWRYAKDNGFIIFVNGHSSRASTSETRSRS